MTALSKTDVIREITQESERDKQRRVGPSALGNPCPRCLGRELAGDADEFRTASLLPWIGTSVHYWLEDHSFPEAEHELKLEVGDVPGYGPIRGTTDVYLDGVVGDWKIVGEKKIKSYRLHGPPLRYRYQIQLYGRGAELSGREVHTVKIIFIPRDGNGDPNNIFVYEEPYDPSLAEQVLERAGKIYEIVQRDGWRELPSHDECYECRMLGLT